MANYYDINEKTINTSVSVKKTLTSMYMKIVYKNM